MKGRNLLLWLFAFLAVVVINVLVIQKEQLLATGQLVLLELAPVDPRSLVQGDYMRLRFDISDEVETETNMRDGFIVVRLDSENVARYVRIYDQNTSLAQDELLLRFRQRTYDVRVGPESFFFQEGTAKYYNNARYGEFRVSKSGDVLLTGLQGEDFEELGPP
ncbi:MAG: hypothetical protein E3J69_02275 [Anaerolineales bacterium]|nr:MAG: hypothetical protein E3J69_02275 [Anaerolineales bacterium]